MQRRRPDAAPQLLDIEVLEHPPDVFAGVPRWVAGLLSRLGTLKESLLGGWSLLRFGALLGLLF